MDKRHSPYPRASWTMIRSSFPWQKVQNWIMHSYTIIARIKKQDISVRMIQGKRERKSVATTYSLLKGRDYSIWVH